MEIPAELRAALDAALSRLATRDGASTVERLIGAYRSGRPASRPILSTMDDVLAYAGYRMPATCSAVLAALRQVSAAAPSFAPLTQLDLGGGTGAAAWAAVEQFATLSGVTVVDQVQLALDLGRELAAGSRLDRARWRTARLDDADLEPADLVTVSYVLGELDPSAQLTLIGRALTVAGALVVVEPGTPAGYERILAVRRAMVSDGMTLVAPCPHNAGCPMVLGHDWCHFSVRVNRSSVHRRLKAAELGFEDEKFSYVAGIRSGAPWRPGRVLRRPNLGRGVVSLYVCTPADGLARTVVSKRQGTHYRSARDVSWGDPWPPWPADGGGRPG